VRMPDEVERLRGIARSLRQRGYIARFSRKGMTVLVRGLTNADREALWLEFQTERIFWDSSPYRGRSVGMIDCEEPAAPKTEEPGEEEKPEEEGRFVLEVCCNCGIEFHMARTLYKERKRDYGTFYCPNGHGQHYIKPGEQQKKENRIVELEQKVVQISKTLYDREEELQQLRVLFAKGQGEIWELRETLKGACWFCYLKDWCSRRWRRRKT
jgi:hypothetical protein